MMETEPVLTVAAQLGVNTRKTSTENSKSNCIRNENIKVPSSRGRRHPSARRLELPPDSCRAASHRPADVIPLPVMKFSILCLFTQSAPLLLSQ